jgi:cytoskeleton protein RodZ
MENESRPTLGGWLRTARETRGATLDEAANVTRIGKNYLRAIEGDEFEKLPSAAYVKGFLRLYAGYLGLSGDEAVARYERQLTGSESAGDEQPAASRPLAVPKQPGLPWGRWGIPLLLLVVIMVIALFPGEKREQRPPAPAAGDKAAASLPPPLQERHSSAAAAPAAAPQPAAAPEATPPGDEAGHGIVLRLKVVQDGPLQMTIDGAVSQQYDLKAGDLIEWKGERMFALELGNAAGVEAELNGVPLKSFGEAGKAVRLVIRADGVHSE